MQMLFLRRFSSSSQWRTVNWQLNPFIFLRIIFSYPSVALCVSMRLKGAHTFCGMFAIAETGDPRDERDTPLLGPAADSTRGAAKLSLPIKLSCSSHASWLTRDSCLLQPARGVRKHKHTCFQNISDCVLCTTYIHLIGNPKPKSNALRMINALWMPFHFILTTTRPFNLCKSCCPALRMFWNSVSCQNLTEDNARQTAPQPSVNKLHLFCSFKSVQRPFIVWQLQLSQEDRGGSMTLFSHDKDTETLRLACNLLYAK